MSSIILDGYGSCSKRLREVCPLVPSAARPYQALSSRFYKPGQSINLLRTCSLTSLHLAIPFQCHQRRPLMVVLRTCNPYGHATRLASSAAPVQAPERRWCRNWRLSSADENLACMLHRESNVSKFHRFMQVN